MTRLPRRSVMLVGAAGLPASLASFPPPRSAPTRASALAAEFHRLAAALPRLDRARSRAARALAHSEEEFQFTEDAAGRVVDWLEAAPVATFADTEALRGVTLVLVEEGLDPARHEPLAAAEGAAAPFRAPRTL